MAERTPTTCDQCGQHDTHPKAHVGGFGGTVTKHHDCLSVAEKQALTASAQDAGSGPKASAVIKACEDGARGDKLLALILDPDALPQAEGLAEKAQRKTEEAVK